MDYNQLGIEAMQEGDYEKAAEAFTKAIEENKEDAIPYINFANLLSSVNELERALAFYDKALELDNSAATAYYGAGNVYVVKEMYKEAKDMFEKALRAGMENGDLFYMLGTVLVKLEQPKLALPYLQRAVELNENDTEARFQFGMCLANEGMLDEALSQFAAVTEQDPGMQMHFIMPVSLMLIKKTEKKRLKCWTRQLISSQIICLRFMLKN